MSYELAVAEGVARMAAAEGLVSYDGTPANLPPVHVQAMRPVTGLCVAVAVYPVTDDPHAAMSTLGVQVKVKDTSEDPRTVAALADDLFDLLHGFAGTLPTGVRVVTSVRQSGTALTQDANNGDWERIDNYYLTVHRPGRNRY